MIERQQKLPGWVRRLWQATFVLLLCGVILGEAMPEVRASALFLLTDGISTVVTGGSVRVGADRIVLTGVESTETDVILEPDRKVEIRHGEGILYATSRAGESVSALLQREGVALDPMEMVRVDLSGEDIVLDIASSFTYYETVAEAAAYTTVYTTDYTLPKGETRVTQQGQPGVCDVTYEVVYADGAFVSRQAVAEANSTAQPEIVSKGTLVTEAQPGDTIAQVVTNDDGSGYLILQSGDSLHFSGSMKVHCTAYTTGDPGVGTITYTGTTVHAGVVAVDKRYIPLDTWMFIATLDGAYTYGMSHAEDTGVMFKEKYKYPPIDLYMNSHDECIQFGRRDSVAYILDR